MGNILGKSDLEKILIGTASNHLIDFEEKGLSTDFNKKSYVSLHQKVLGPYEQLKNSAAENGFALRVLSGYRSFDHQVKIWNDKISGKRMILDDSSKPITHEDFSAWEKIQAILRWTALPGTSRHHWGTDFDVYDANALSPNYRVQLMPSEYIGDGIFSDFYAWLMESIGPSGTYKSYFFQPYAIDNGGIAPEPWHLSYKPVADCYEKELNINMVKKQILISNLSEKKIVLMHLEEILDRYVVRK